MKLLAGVVLVGLSLVAARAQEENGLPAADVMPGVVYEAPVIYEAPIVYQAPVAYYAPVYYLNSYYPTPECPRPPCPAPSTVTYIGGRSGSIVQANCGNSSSTVFHFGGQQACAYGYQFNRPR